MVSTTCGLIESKCICLVQNLPPELQILDFYSPSEYSINTCRLSCAKLNLHPQVYITVEDLSFTLQGPLFILKYPALGSGRWICMAYHSSGEQPLALQLLIEFSHLASTSGAGEGRRRLTLVPYGPSILLRRWLCPWLQGHSCWQSVLSTRLFWTLFINMP